MSYDFTLTDINNNEYYSSNYTSNIYDMVDNAFKKLKEKGLCNNKNTHWSDEINYEQNPKYILELITELKSNPTFYKKYNPKNNWGDYESFIIWLQEINSNIQKLQKHNQVFWMEVTW